MKTLHNRKPILIILGLLALIALAFASGYYTNEITRSPGEQLLDAAYQVVARDSIFNQKGEMELSYAAIRGMLTTIDDPYAELIEPEAAAQFSRTFSGQTGVVGLYAEKIEQQVVVSIVFTGGSAANAGLQHGDVITSIDQQVLDPDTDSSEAGLLLRGEPGSTVHIEVLRQGKVLEFDLERQVQVFVTSQMLPDGIGYISLSAFNATATEQMKSALEDLLAQNPRAIIWDLRNNEGGDMLAAQEMLSFFIDEGLLFTAELTQGRTVQFQAKGNPLASDIPLVVLMDQSTYSAAETCASTIAESGRGMTIGGTSYGKGVIQATIPLPEDVLLQITIARWKSYNGEWYQGSGVAPLMEAADNPATETDELLEAAIQYLSEH